MGNHAKIVPRKIKIGKREETLRPGDFLVECIPDRKEIFLENFDKGMPEACLIRIFRVEIFDEETAALWQTSEGICIKKNEVSLSKFWGYEGTLILEKVMDITVEKIAPACLKKKKPVIRVIKPGEFKATVSTLTKKLVKKD